MHNIKDSLRVILDCDTGEDDALAILLAVRNHLPLDYVVTSYGNSTLENATRNSSRLLSLSQATDIKVLPGSTTPLTRHLIEHTVSAGSFVGKNGICNVELEPSRYENIIQTDPDEFVQILIDEIKSHSKTDYIITGPCTNFAKVCQVMGTEIHQYIRNVFIMGGSVYTPGNSGPRDPVTHEQVAEFNFYCDPVAADLVLRSGLPISLVSWDITSTVKISYPQIQRFTASSPIGKFAIDLMNNFFRFYGLGHDRTFELNDPLTVLAYMGWGNYRDEKIKVITEMQNYGKSVQATDGSPVRYFTLTPEEIQKAISRILVDIDIDQNN